MQDGGFIVCKVVVEYGWFQLTVQPIILHIVYVILDNGALLQ